MVQNIINNSYKSMRKRLRDQVERRSTNICKIDEQKNQECMVTTYIKRDSILSRVKRIEIDRYLFNPSQSIKLLESLTALNVDEEMRKC